MRQGLARATWSDAYNERQMKRVSAAKRLPKTLQWFCVTHIAQLHSEKIIVASQSQRDPTVRLFSRPSYASVGRIAP